MNFWESMKAFYLNAAPYMLLAGIVITLFAIILIAILIGKQNRLKKRLDKFLRGSDGASLEERLEKVIDDNQRVKIQLKNNINEIVKLNDEMLTAYRKIGIVKFNAFPGMAGKMSSSICLLNNENNGLIVNTIHGQEGCHTYVKEIMNGKSITALTEEDEEALKKAMDMQI